MIRVRTAGDDDVQRLFEWRNDPVTIENLRTRRSVTWDGHVEWFAKTLARDDARILITEYGGGPAGVFYFERLESEVWATHSNSNPDFRGKGLSAHLLCNALNYMTDFEKASKFSTIIKDDNVPAVKMYARCGFHLVWPTSDGFSIYAT